LTFACGRPWRNFTLENQDSDHTCVNVRLAAEPTHPVLMIMNVFLNVIFFVIYKLWILLYIIIYDVMV